MEGWDGQGWRGAGHEIASFITSTLDRAKEAETGERAAEGGECGDSVHPIS